VFEDNGIGIDMERYGDKVFGLYKRFHMHVEGTGIGLHLVKSQVEALNGHILLTSKVDQGTRFTIELHHE
jgi:signal transduction histidine kinase